MERKSANHSLSPHQRERLLHEAELAAANAYAPYSGFRVGAAVWAVSVAIYRGANIENCSYGLSLCAERVALAAARVAWEEKIVAIAIACVNTSPDSPLHQKLPCGACCQWIQELAPEAEIFVAGINRSFCLPDLLPHPFRMV